MSMSRVTKKQLAKDEKLARIMNEVGIYDIPGIQEYLARQMMPEDEVAALDTLGVRVADSILSRGAVIKPAYRRKAQQHHPDKGGDPDEFMRVKTAYERLRGRYEQRVLNDEDEFIASCRKSGGRYG